MDSMTWEFILRIFVAALLGGAIGLEREYRAKEAGFRTHFLVALGSALFMIVSAYGFDGAMYTPEHRWDVSRVAAQVVSGIGFIGAGTMVCMFLPLLPRSLCLSDLRLLTSSFTSLISIVACNNCTIFV